MTGLFGIGLRRPYFDSILTHHRGVDFLEIVTENFMDFGGRPRAVLHAVRDRFPVIPHGVSLSIGGPDPLDDTYLQALRALLNTLRPPWFSDHVCYASAFGVHYHDLLPMPFSYEAAMHTAKRAAEVQDRMDVPFLLENPTYYCRMPGSEMGEAQFLREVVERADCGLLLDVNNVWVNSQNHGEDPYAFIDALPLHRVRQIHMAGHDASGVIAIDTHGGHVIGPVFELYQYVMQRVPKDVWTLLEWDQDLPSLEVLLCENDRIRAVADKAHHSPASQRLQDGGDPSIAQGVESNRSPSITMHTMMQQMHGMLRGESSPHAVATGWMGAYGADAAAKRLRLYQGFVHGHIREALEKNYTVLAALLPPPVWERLVNAFFQRFPADTHELNDCARAFPEFVQTCCDEPAWEGVLGDVHVEVADLEWQEWVAYATQVEVPTLDHVLQPIINPTLTVLSCAYPLREFMTAARHWMAAQEEHATAHGEAARGDQLDHAMHGPPAWPTEQQPEILFVMRHPKTLSNTFVRADEPLMFAFKMVHDGLSVADAAAAGQISESQVMDLLVDAARLGVVILPRAMADAA